MMQSYTFGSDEAVGALTDAIQEAGPGRIHHFAFSEGERVRFAEALETADVLGYAWADQMSGIDLGQSEKWPDHFADINLTGQELCWLVVALRRAWSFGDEFAGEWLSSLAITFDIEWI